MPRHHDVFKEQREQPVLSHPGERGQIYLGPYAAGIEGETAPEVDARAIWARWDRAQTLGWAGEPDRVSEPAVVVFHGYTLTIDDGVTLTRGEADDATATFHGPREAVVRLVLGRLKPGFTHDEITVSGNVALDDLRRAFPGY